MLASLNDHLKSKSDKENELKSLFNPVQDFVKKNILESLLGAYRQKRTLGKFC